MRIIQRVALWNTILLRAGLGDADLSATHIRGIKVGNLRRELVRVRSEDHDCSVSHSRLELETGSVLQTDFAVNRGGQLSCLFCRQVPSRSPIDELVTFH